MQQLQSRSDVSGPASELLLGLQSHVRLSQLQRGRHALRQATEPDLHHEPHGERFSALQSVAITIREISRYGGRHLGVEKT